MERPDQVSPHRGLVLTGFTGCGAALAWILLWPRADVPTWVVLHSTQALLDAGLPASVVDGSRIEFLLNAAMVAPMATLGVMLWPRWSWERWTAYAFVVSCGVELVQAVLMPLRSAQYVDVVANTLGAAAGAVLGKLVVARARRGRSAGTAHGSAVGDPYA